MALVGSTYIRSPLARAVYNRMIEDQYEATRDHSEWYCVNENRLSAELREKFLSLHEDDETKQFLRLSSEKSDFIFVQIYHTIVKCFLSWVLNNTTINGLLRRGSMFVFSKRQFEFLLNIDVNWKRRRLLDLGAGDGMVTRQMAGHFDEVFVTEMSTTMKWRLQEHGFKIVETENWFQNASIKYDVIACLNLLDRCDQPIEILQQIRSVLEPKNGRLLLAVVIPFSPYVEMGANGSHKPRQPLPVKGRSFEEQVQSLVVDVLEPSGYILESFSRLPYLCEGDLQHSFYVLTDAIFVLKPNETQS